MPSDKVKNYIHLHFLVVIAGFTAVLGELISLEAVPLVWYRMSIGSLLMIIYIKYKKISLRVPLKVLFRFSIAGVIIALHWITFFAAIKASNISITLAMFSTGAFFASLIEPFFFKRKIIVYEILFGLIVIIGVILITKTEFRYILGIILGISSALFSTLFAVLNGKFVEEYPPSIISFYEFISGVVFMSIFLALNGDGFNTAYFQLSSSDWINLFILASICFGGGPRSEIKSAAIAERTRIFLAWSDLPLRNSSCRFSIILTGRPALIDSIAAMAIGSGACDLPSKPPPITTDRT